ncbi:MAG: tetratricopeptide repeat protein [Nitrospira sp.]|nr:tetratricopeptide repeat protein [Nitrospira sp.]
MALGLLMVPMLSYASPCSEFQWHYPHEMNVPEAFEHGRESLQHFEYAHAREYFSEFLREQPEGVLAEAAAYALASLPAEDDPPDEQALNVIKRLSVQRQATPQSPYAPWALCRMGELYQESGWSTEAKGAFEEFLATYPEHPLVGGILLNAGNSFLKDRQYIEASLVYRRIVQEPRWSRYQVQGALGLADATAFSGAWDQAYYWYQVVDAENPRLIRTSAASSFYYGLTKAKKNQPLDAVDWYLITYNLHPQAIESGYALNHIGQYLLSQHRELAALWFFQESASHYAQEEPGRRGKAGIIRWMVSYLSSEHTRDEWKALHDRLDALDLFLLVSWDGVIEAARSLVNSPEPELAEEAQFWLGKAHEGLEDQEGAIAAYGELVISGQYEPWKTHAQEILTAMLLREFRALSKEKKWVELLRFYDTQQLRLRFLPQKQEWMRLLANAYDQIGLSRQALKWYDAILQLAPPIEQHDEILFRSVRLAQAIRDDAHVRQAAETYLQAYPTGTRRDDVLLILGHLDAADKRYKESVQHFSSIVDSGHDKTAQRHARHARARAHVALKQFKEAIDDYRYLVEHGPAPLAVKFALADLLYEQQRYAEAIPVYRGIVDSEAPVEADTWATFRLALCFQKTGKSGEATKLLEKIRKPGQEVKDLEATIRAAAAAVIEEYLPIKETS